MPLAADLSWLASCAVAVAFLAAVWSITRVALGRRRRHVSAATVVLTASLVGGSMSLIALALLSST